MPKKAKGLPDPKDYGDISTLPVGELVPWFIQQHDALRAGKHLDVRLGPDQLFSWATKKKLPEPGGKPIRLFQQPLHSQSYGGWQGILSGGYGAGKVTSKVRGKILLTKVKPDAINFTTAYQRHPERFKLIRSKDDPKVWLLINVTPQVPLEFKKTHYTKVPAADVDKLLQPGMSTSAKIDGAAAFLKLLKDRVELVSYRASKAGRPILHTERVFGTLPKIDIPKELIGTVLRGEIYGTKEALEHNLNRDQGSEEREELTNGDYPDEAEEGKAFCFQWAEGMGVCAFKNKADAIMWAEKGADDWTDIDKFWYGEPKFKDKPITVSDSYTPPKEKKAAAPEWPKVHVSGVSGAGKTTLMNKLKPEFPTMQFKDQDDFWLSVIKKIIGKSRFDSMKGEDFEDLELTDEQEDEYDRVKRQRELAYMRRHKQPVLFGIHDAPYDPPDVKHKMMLSTSPLKATFRRWKRDHPSLRRAWRTWMMNRRVRKELLELGYKPMGAEGIKKELVKIRRNYKRKSAAFRAGLSLGSRFREAIHEQSN